jgi:hypothetical protein
MLSQSGVCRALRGKAGAEFCDSLIAALAERQHGVVSRRQLVEHGVNRYAVDRRIERRLLQAVHRGVFAVGHRSLTAEGRWMAAVLAGGPGAVLSHRTAATLLGILRSPYLELTTPTQRYRSGINIHSSLLAVDEVTTERCIPVTTVPRTLLDLATVLRPTQLERAINEAEVQRLSDPLSLLDLLKRYPGRPGTPAIRAILDKLSSGARITRSELEDRFLAFVAEAGLPPPEVNAWLFVRATWIECDCVWRPQRLVVELDGHAVHGTGAAFEADRARDRALQAEGWRVIRITWHQLQYNAQPLANDLRVVLSRASL